MRAIQYAFVVSLIVLVACGDDGAATPDAAQGAACSDGIDNDGDGTTDFPDDLGCESADSTTESGAVKPQCQDNRDNDGDGKIDFPNDPGCAAGLVDDELDNCPSGPGCPQCSDGMDNDGNGKTDFPSDAMGCMSAADTVEFTDDPNACGQGMVIKMLPTNGMDMGTLVGSTSTVSSPCGGGNGLPGIAYVFHLSAPKVVVASTDDPMTAIDTVLDLRSSMCTVPGAELACHDDIMPTGSTPNRTSTITKSLPAGTYYLIVGGKTSADTGMYSVKVEQFSGEGTPCTLTTDCGPGLECRIPTGQTQMVCTGPVCNDLRDDDGDGKIDYPLDPGCTSPTDMTETDVCNTMPSDPMCPQCGNGMDDDMDGNTDYPADTSCTSASSSSESCTQSEAVATITQRVTMGTTMGTMNDYTPPTACTGNSNAGDLAYRLNVPNLATLNVAFSGYDTVHALMDSTCQGTPLACFDEPPLITRTNVTAGTFYVIVDGYGTNSGAFTLTVTGEVAAGGSCESPLFAAGAFTCAAGYACSGMPGMRTCAPAACNDMMDNDGDGKSDFPADPGCTSPSDGVETDDCYPTVGPNCPACGNAADDDSDMTTDYPNDTSCPSASFFVENFCSLEVAADVEGEIAAPTTTANLAMAADNYDQPCQASTGNDVAFGIRLPVPVASLQLDTIGSPSADTVVSLWNVTCGASLGCDDDGAPGSSDFRSSLTVTNVAAGDYAIQVDSYSTTNNQGITLNVRGTVAGGVACTHPLFAAGVLACATGYTCMTGVCTGSTACNDGMDNDGDGKTNYPADPGCASPLDNDETDDCYPTVGPNCPACGNALDDDMDMLTDYPTDTRCPSASFFVENFCAPEVLADVAGMITTAATTGSLVAATDNYDQSCQSNTNHDVAYGLRLPVAVTSLQIDTIGSESSDTVVSLWDAACGTSLGCDDDGDPNSARSLLTVSNVAAGNYAIQVDAYSTGNDLGITLNVRGTVASGTACTDPLFAAGVLVCPATTTCTAGTCQ